ncbi:trafficking protein particle complex subunit 12-like [Daphnia carinata]|uniref:trafficking protein particle complex subunit 12-like n=1 Tax=Daphnia carinata TaxID=120202 RepID=UPI00257D64B4|nr:trafficking protein particle complex subunit 12-like [Daphnia carinata]XP_057374769.1 trafficking protein particle complex subunit 12-like [Daphnia carinata]
MASGLPDALERLALKAEQSENEQGTSFSKYFGQPGNTDDIFDTIVKPSRLADEEPKINFFKSPNSTPSKEDVHQNYPPKFAFKKGEKESEPKIFSYFSQPTTTAGELNTNNDATEFFDQMSQLASKSHEPIEIAGPGFRLSSEDINPSKACSQALPVTESTTIPSNQNSEASVSADTEHSSQVSSTSAANLVNSSHNISSVGAIRVFTPQPVVPNLVNETDQTVKTLSDSQERASNWWIPKEPVRLWLQSTRANFSETFHPSCPGLLNSIELTDPIKDLLRHFDGEAAAAERQTLTADMVTQDAQGIRDLIKVGCYRAAANLCGRLLTACGQGYGKAGQPSKHTPHSLNLWMTRLALLKKSNLVEMAVNELDAFGDLDSPDFYYEYYPELNDQKKHGTMVPFTFRLLAAELPAHHNRVNEAHMKLCHLLSTVRRIIRDIDQFAALDKMNEVERREAANMWSDRETAVLQSLITCSLMKKDFHNVVRLFHKQLHRPGHKPNPTLYSALGRVYLQIGDIPLAQQAFNCAVDLRDINKPGDAIASLTDAGLVAIAQNAFSEALGYFQQALALQPDNPVLVNNTAVCLLYVGRMRDGMLLLEENLGTKPEMMIRNDTVLNVCTLYELESSLTVQRKLGMLRLASKWKNDDLNIASFKLQIQ